MRGPRGRVCRCAVAFWAVLLLGAVSACTLLAQAAAPERPAEGRVAEGERVDLNTATLDQLRALPGMGAEYARRVIAHRPYSAKNQLLTRGILPEAAYAAVAPYVIAHRVTKN